MMTASKIARQRERERWSHITCPRCGRETNRRGICWRDDFACGWRPWRPDYEPPGGWRPRE